MISLHEQLYILNKEIEAKSTPEITQLKQEIITEMISHNAEDKAIKLNETIPSHDLLDPFGNTFTVSADKLSGKTIFLFYRGGWCPYCNVELNHYQQNLNLIKEKGYNLIAISPDLPDNSLTLKGKENLEYDVLSDINNGLAIKFGIATKRPSAYEKLVSLLGNNIDKNHDYLPIPSKFIIDSSGKVIYRAFNPDYRERVDLEKILQ